MCDVPSIAVFCNESIECFPGTLLLLLLLFTEIGFLLVGSGYFTCIQNMKLVTTNFKAGGLNEKYVVAIGIMGTISAFAFRHRETKKNLSRDGRSQELPNTVS